MLAFFGVVSSRPFHRRIARCLHSLVMSINHREFFYEGASSLLACYVVVLIAYLVLLLYSSRYCSFSVFIPKIETTA